MAFWQWISSKSRRGLRVLQQVTTNNFGEASSSTQSSSQQQSQPGASVSATTPQFQPSQVVDKTRIDLVKLVPFDVTIALTQNSGISVYEVTDIVMEWMNDSFREQVQDLNMVGSYSAFDSIILDERMRRRHHRHNNRELLATNSSSLSSSLSTSSSSLSSLSSLESEAEAEQQAAQSHRELPERYVASYEGVSLWKHTPGLEIVSKDIVEALERQALSENGKLLSLLQQSMAVGLGAAVIDVRAFVNPALQVPMQAGGGSQSNNFNGGNASSSDSDLELIIVVAIVVACLAFIFLVFALFWAWRFDKQRREDMNAYRNRNSPTGTGSTSHNKPLNQHGKSKRTDGTGSASEVDSKSNNDEDNENKSLPSEIHPTRNHASRAPEVSGAGVYPESVISEDISTSLSAYYRSGMGKIAPPITGAGTNGETTNNGSNMARPSSMMNDAASFSSMESYGYSLDGYAPSINNFTVTSFNNNYGGMTTQESDEAPKKSS